MAKGFDDLIEFLLEEIALRGEQGASTSDFKDLINKFYAEQDDDVRPSRSASRAAGSTGPGHGHVDRRLQERVWTWLTAHPDICFNGRPNERIPLLPEFEALENQTKTGRTDDAPDGAGETGDAAPPSPAENASPKLFVSEERMWMAMTGHGVDPKRIPRHEFIILSIIAAHGEKGVVQPEITRISGQDKRSVPKRTDNLAKHGYITKVHVLAKGTRTSLCTLKRYAKTQRDKRAALPPISARSSPEEIKAVIFQDGLLLYDKFFDILMDILQDCKIVTIEDCKRKLGITTKTWEMKSLWRSMRRLEGLGLVKKVKAQIKGSMANHKWYRCIKIVREPTQRDRMIFVTMSMKEAKKHKRETEAGEEEDAEGEIDADEEHEEADASQALVQQESDVQEIKRLPPQWDPDRPVINLLWDIIKNSGHSGATTAIIRDQGLGTFYRRPIDAILGRISDIWHISQPPHLRHFAIIRDTGQSDKYLHYVYRSYGNFQLAVDVGEAAWEVVITQPVNMNAGKKPRAKNQKNVRETIHHEYGELNEWGFPEIHESCFEGRNGLATLKDSSKNVMASVKPLPSRGYIPKFVTGGYVRSQRDVSVETDDDFMPVSSRKKPALGDTPKRKYNRKSTDGPGLGKRKRSLLNSDLGSSADRIDDVTRGDFALALADTLDGSVDDRETASIADRDGADSDTRPVKRPYKRRQSGKGKAAESEHPMEKPEPGVYINPPWGKKPRDPTHKGRPKKAKVVIMVLEALKEVAVDSSDFSIKVDAAKERSEARIQVGKERAAAAEAQSQSAAVPEPNVTSQSRYPASLPANEDFLRQTDSAEPPIFHMLDEMPFEKSTSTQFTSQDYTTQAQSTPEISPPNLVRFENASTPTAITSTAAQKKRGRPRKDPNAPPRPRKSLKKAEDTVPAATPDPQVQQLPHVHLASSEAAHLPAELVTSSSNPTVSIGTPLPKRRGRKPKSQIAAEELARESSQRRNSTRSTGSQAEETQFSLQTPATSNPFVAMAEEYQRSYPSLYTPVSQPFNPFVAAAQEHNRSITTTPVPPRHGSATDSSFEVGSSNEQIPSASKSSNQRLIPTPNQADKQRSSNPGSNSSFATMRQTTLGQSSFLNRRKTRKHPSAASNAVDMTSSPASTSAGQEYGRQLLPKPSPLIQAATQQHQPPGAHQSPYSGEHEGSRHGGLYDQLRQASHNQDIQSTPNLAGGDLRKPESGGGPVWGSFASSNNRHLNSTSSLAVQSVGTTPRESIAQPLPTVRQISAPNNGTVPEHNGKTLERQTVEASDDNGSETEVEPELFERVVLKPKNPSSNERATIPPANTAAKSKEAMQDVKPSLNLEETQASFITQPPTQKTLAREASFQAEEMPDEPPVQEDAEDQPQENSVTPSTPKQGSVGQDGARQICSAPAMLGTPSQVSPAQVSGTTALNEDIPVLEEAPENPTPVKRQKGKWLGGKKQGVKLSGGGILNFNRTKLLVSIIEKCGGVFPGDFEIHRPFVGLWNKEYGAERQVDRDTIKRTIKNAIDSSRVRRFAYSFKNKNGAMMTRHILTLPHIKQSDPLVLDTQKKVIAAWPRVYTPLQMKEYEEEVGNSWYGDKYEKDTTVRVERANLPQWMRDMELRTAENQRKREEEKARKLEREARGIPRLGRAGRGRGGRGRGTSRPVITGRTGRRQRLAGLPKPVADPDEDPWNPFQSKFMRLYDSEDDGGLDEPTTPSRPRSMGEMSGTFQIDNFVFHRPTHDSALLSDDDDSSVFGTPFSSRSGTPIPKSPSKRMRRSSSSSISTIDGIEIPGRVPTFQVNISPSMSRRGSVASVASDVSSASSSPSISSFRIEKPRSKDWSFKNSGPDTYDPTWEIQDIATLTDPDILFYPHTGTFSTEYHVVRNARLSLWVQPRAQHQQDFEDSMPRSLQQMKDSIKMKGKDRDHSRRGNQNLSRFERELIVVSHWEDQYMRKSEDLGLILRQPHFINHTFFGDHEEPETEWSWKGLDWDNPYSQNLTPFDPPSFDETDESDAPDAFVTESGRSRRKAANAATRATKRRRRTMVTDAQEGSPAEPSRRRQKATKLPKAHLSRGPAQDPLCVISTADTKKLLYAMVVVQSLLGGLEGYTSWDQIRKIFSTHAHWDLTSFRNRWVWLKTRCAEVVESLFDEFQQAYLLAYECGDVPPIDYDNVDDYDWPGIVQWTMQNISIKPPKETDVHAHIPSTREELENIFDVQEVNPWSGPPKESLYGEGCLSSRRRELTQQYSFYLPLTHRPKRKEKASAWPYSQKALDRAKTWVRSTIVAPEEQFDRDSFGEKLKKLDDKLVTKATSELISTKYFRDEQKGRTKPGRNYGIDRTFPKAFERQLQPVQLLDAIQFKEDLDKAFSSGAASYTISNAAKDGHVLVIINLAQAGLVKVVPVLPPIDHTIGKPFPRLTKWGFTEGHYKTVQMDRGRLTWSIDIVPTDRYVYGNPLLKSRGWNAFPAPPLPEKGSEHDGFVPLWVDLFNRTIEEWWRRVVTAIIHVVFGRPGIGVRGIKKALKDAMDEWEIELCVKWLMEVGALEEMRLGVKDGEKARGWRLGEWWWCVLGEREVEQVDARAY